MRVEDTPMIQDSDGDKSEYEAHFSQSMAKGDKAHKQANRTPEGESKPTNKTGKKQKKQLQFGTQEGAPPEAIPGKTGDAAPPPTLGGSKGEAAPKKLKDPLPDRRDGGTTTATEAPKPDRRRGKEAGASKSPGK
ncbi:unnamed protein product [Calypogeia fissa]